MSPSRRVVYIAHPLSAPTLEGIEANRARASRWAAWAAVARGVSPSCSWIVLTGQLPETPEMRRLGLELDCAQVERCDEVWLVGGRVSSGMVIEAEHGRKRGIPVFNMTDLGEEPPWSREERALRVTEPAPAPRDEQPTLVEVPTGQPPATLRTCLHEEDP